LGDDLNERRGAIEREMRRLGAIFVEVAASFNRLADLIGEDEGERLLDSIAGMEGPQEPAPSVEPIEPMALRTEADAQGAEPEALAAEGADTQDHTDHTVGRRAGRDWEAIVAVARRILAQDPARVWRPLELSRAVGDSEVDVGSRRGLHNGLMKRLREVGAIDEDESGGIRAVMEDRAGEPEAAVAATAPEPVGVTELEETATASPKAPERDWEAIVASALRMLADEPQRRWRPMELCRAIVEHGIDAPLRGMHFGLLARLRKVGAIEEDGSGTLCAPTSLGDALAEAALADASIAAPQEVPPAPEPSIGPDPLTELGLLAQRIEAATPEVGMMAPALQRLHLSAWICRARGIEEHSDFLGPVTAAVRRIAGRLGRLAKAWWPGSVVALQLKAEPADMVDELGLSTVPSTWHEAAEAVETRLQFDLIRDDDGGWSDGDCLQPPPNDPESRLSEARATVEEHLGLLDHEKPIASSDVLFKPAKGVLDELVRAAMLLRWLRLHVVDQETWARAVGRLRWACRQGRELGSLLEPLLDPGNCPEHPWPAMLGIDPEAKRHQRLRQALLRDTPGVRSNVEEVASWLVRALAIGEDLPVSRIASLVEPHREMVLALDGAALPGGTALPGGMRNKLTKLKRHLGAPEEPAVNGSQEVPADMDESGDHVLGRVLGRVPGRVLGHVLGAKDADDRPALAPLSSTIEDLRRAVIRHLPGPRALFVSNRADPALKEALEQQIELVLDWCEAEPRRIQSACERVAGGRYDLVLCATGFVSHKVDGALARAARAAAIPYVRASSGRSTSCILALSRQLGVAGM
jgi:hypothetical protein